MQSSIIIIGSIPSIHKKETIEETQTNPGGYSWAPSSRCTFKKQGKNPGLGNQFWMRRADDVVGAASIAHTCKNIPFNFRLLCLNLSTLSNSSNHLLIYSPTINPKNAVLSSHTAQDFLPRLRIIAKWINGRLWYSTSESNRTKSLQRPRKFDCSGGIPADGQNMSKRSTSPWAYHTYLSRLLCSFTRLKNAVPPNTFLVPRRLQFASCSAYNP